MNENQNLAYNGTRVDSEEVVETYCLMRALGKQIVL